MVIAEHIGRLGNSMFQIAAAIGYAKKFNYEWAVDYGSGKGHPYSSIHKVFPNLPKNHLGGRLYHEHPRDRYCKLHDMPLDLCHFDFHPFDDKGRDVILFGFWQSYKYFEHCEDVVKNLFKLDKIDGFEDYCAIHVRRGDYVENAGSFPPVNETYIRNAMEKVPTKKFIFLSDDIEWCRATFGDSFEYSRRNEKQDLSLMASCGHQIISNSTFSWWGAYLRHTNGLVISPSCKRGDWFGLKAGVKKDVVDLLPPDWIQITNFR